ncbi:CMD domain-containing protein [Allopusillimonas ginsengisoli]|uniref:CMD domain-containing protein n=1 Tax=Allopusillimonas ginsengisoli TaxID=453575 RepID=UPI00101F96F6|nr:CMD domain protein [Allopusillimonas ginsengisoli]TEA78340.1 CMD domain protein [Allopusillimonas ginsengisoli]
MEHPAVSPATAHTPADDVIDMVVGLTPDDALYATRHARQKVVDATQASHALFFAPEGHQLPLGERLLIALHACRLSHAATLTQHYRAALQASSVDTAALAAVEAGDIATLPDSPLKAMLVFTETLITRPIEGDKAALQALHTAGLSTPDIVTLAQLVAYLSYQIRVVAGLSAMKASEAA